MRIVLLFVASLSISFVTSGQSLKKLIVNDKLADGLKTENNDYWIDDFQNGIAKISKEGYLGLVDSTGKILCVPKYDKIFDHNGKMFRTVLDGKYGLMDYNGLEICEPKFIRLSDFSEGVARFTRKNIYLYGLINEIGQILTEPKYEYISNYNEGYATFKRGNNFGIIDQQGQELVLMSDFDYNSPDRKIFSINDNWFMGTNEHYSPLFAFKEELTIIFKKVNKKYKYGFINQKGIEVIAASFDWATPFVDGCAAVKNGNYWGVIDKKGSIIIPIKYGFVEVISNHTFIVSEENKWGIINANLNPVIPIKYGYVSHLFKDLYSVFDPKATANKISGQLIDTSFIVRGAWGILNERGEVIMPFKYARIERANDNYGIAYVTTGIRHLATSLPRYIQYEECDLFSSNGRIGNDSYMNRFLMEGLWYLKELRFDMQSQYRYQKWVNVTHKTNEVKAYQMSETEYVYLNDKGEQIIDATFDFAYGFQNKLSVIGKSDTSIHKTRNTLFLNHNGYIKYHYGLINKSGEEVIPAIYDLIMDFNKDFVPARLNYKWGILNLKGEEILPFEYDYITLTSSGAIVRKGNYHGLLDLKGNLILPLEYKYMEEVTTEVGLGLLSVEQSGQRFCINKKGHRINEF